MKTKLLTFCGVLLCLVACQEKPSYEGYVKDAHTGEPLEDAEVLVILDMKKCDAFSVRTDANGFYKVNLPVDKAVKINYRCLPYQQALQDVTMTKDAVEAGKGHVKAPDVLLQLVNKRLSVYCGKVVDENGKPLKDVRVVSGATVLGKTNSKGGYITAFGMGNHKAKLAFAKDGYTREEREVTTDSLGSCVVGPDVVLKKEKK